MVYKGTTWTLDQDKECKCIVCGTTFLAKTKANKYCSSHCKRIYLGIIPNKNYSRKCKVCGKEFTTNKSVKVICSIKCKYNAHDKRYDGITIDSDISLFKLAERDHQQCQICGLYVNWEDIDNNIAGNMYPSIDHIRPISLGGFHSWDNVQLAHRYCNSKKCNKYIG